MVYVIIGLFITLFLLGMGIIAYCNTIIKMNTIIIKSDKIEKNSDIVFVSDFHVGKYTRKKRLIKIINKINRFNGDYLLIGGDMVGKKTLKYYTNEDLKDIFNNLKIKKRYFVGGNHDDYNLDLYKNFTILNDEIIKLGNNINLVGLKWEKGECLDCKLLRGNYNILLSHYPDRICEYSKIDLALGAHSHGNQVNLPFCKFHHKEKYTRGLYDLKNNKYLYVNKGLGFSLLKIRFLSCCEIVKIELRKCSSNGSN